MRRADRLFQLVQLIRGRRLRHRAAFLASGWRCRLRTVYRDVADLQHQGVPIEGEAGVGYRLGSGFELPPLMFTQAEANALVIASRARPSKRGSTVRWLAMSKARLARFSRCCHRPRAWPPRRKRCSHRARG